MQQRQEGFVSHSKEALDDLRPIFAGICADFDAGLVEFDGEDDHVHLLVNYPPKVAVSALVNNLNSQEELPEHPQEVMGRRKARTATPSALSFPALKREVCRATDQTAAWRTAAGAAET